MPLIDRFVNAATRLQMLQKKPLFLSLTHRPSNNWFTRTINNGNDDYQHVTKLETAVKDARAVAKLLREKYKFDVVLLLDATRSDIFTAFSKLRRKLKPATIC